MTKFDIFILLLNVLLLLAILNLVLELVRGREAPSSNRWRRISSSYGPGYFIGWEEEPEWAVSLEWSENRSSSASHMESETRDLSAGQEGSENQSWRASRGMGESLMQGASHKKSEHQR